MSFGLCCDSISAPLSSAAPVYPLPLLFDGPAKSWTTDSVTGKTDILVLRDDASDSIGPFLYPSPVPAGQFSVFLKGFPAAPSPQSLGFQLAMFGASPELEVLTATRDKQREVADALAAAVKHAGSSATESQVKTAKDAHERLLQLEREHRELYDKVELEVFAATRKIGQRTGLSPAAFVSAGNAWMEKPPAAGGARVSVTAKEACTDPHGHLCYLATTSGGNSGSPVFAMPPQPDSIVTSFVAVRTYACAQRSANACARAHTPSILIRSCATV
jgi:hypothetical protein